MKTIPPRFWNISQVGAGLALLLGLLVISLMLTPAGVGVISVILLAMGASLLVVAGSSQILFSNRLIKPHHYSGVGQIFLGIGELSLLYSLPRSDTVNMVLLSLLGLFSLAYGVMTLYRPAWVNAPEGRQSLQQQI